MAWASLVAQMVKNLPAMQKTQVQSPGQEDPLEKGMATHSSIFAWKIPWRREWQPTLVFLPGKSHAQRILVGCSPWGLIELDVTEQLINTNTTTL